MYSPSSKQIRHGYSVIRVSLDDHRDHTVPVGVVAWQTTNPWYGWRWLEHDEKVRGVDPATRRLMRITKDQIHRWAKARRVPYEPEPVEPTSDRFWKAVSEILSTSVRLDLPKAMDPMDEPDTGIEALFEAVVQPAQTRQRRTERIDSAMKRALGEWADRIPPRQSVSAFGGATEQIQRGLETERGVLLVEGVNLATPKARKEADALVSRFLRIQAAYPTGSVRMIVGYSSSPGGLNGEAHMCEWIREKVTGDVYDVAGEHAELQRAAEEAWRRFNGEPLMGLRSST